jgi:cytochrome c553
MWMVVLVLLIITAMGAAGRFLRDEPESFADAEMQFKYGSTGGDKVFGIPFAVWQVLPTMFADKLPAHRRADDWTAFGFIHEEADHARADAPRQRRPVGTTLRNYMGIDRIFLNCAVCHAGTVRKAENEAPQLVLGMGANTIDLEAFQRFLIEVGKDDRLTGANVVAAIDEKGIELDLINRLALRFIGIKQMRDLIGRIGERFRFVEHEPEFGPGRFDTFSPAKALLNWPRQEIPEHERIGVVDFPTIWNQDAKRHMWLHWDGNNRKLEERNRSAAFGTGATFPSLDRVSVGRIEEWLMHQAKPPPLSAVLGITIDGVKAERGKAIYASQCAACHGISGSDFSGPLVGQTTHIDLVRTDRYRLDNYTYDLMINQNALYAGNAEERFQNFRKTHGYANAPLDGLWLRAPYLHNGSVPTLRDLLKPPQDRPDMFLRGHDVYDAENLGFESRPEMIPPDTAKRLFCQAADRWGEAKCAAAGGRLPLNNDTCADGICKGNGNGGHLYGIYLPESDKDDLIEYLKTF